MNGYSWFYLSKVRFLPARGISRALTTPRRGVVAARDDGRAARAVRFPHGSPTWVASLNGYSWFYLSKVRFLPARGISRALTTPRRGVVAARDDDRAARAVRFPYGSPTWVASLNGYSWFYLSKVRFLPARGISRALTTPRRGVVAARDDDRAARAVRFPYGSPTWVASLNGYSWFYLSKVRFLPARGISRALTTPRRGVVAARDDGRAARAVRFPHGSPMWVASLYV